MENIFVEFLPPWVETGLQPAFYDKESGTVLQQTARMYARVNMLIRMFNKLSKNTKTEIERFETAVNEDMTQYKHDINETVANYIEQFNQLHDYVHDYFDNLDVQEEINNKLDDMVEQGTLQEIIADYLNSRALFGFDTVADMKAATNLIDGSFAYTMGYYTINDCGCATYKITSTEPSGYYETLNSGLYAELLVDDVMCVKQFGAKGDGLTDDTTKLNACLTCGAKDIVIDSGTYLISGSLSVTNNVSGEDSVTITFPTADPSVFPTNSIFLLQDVDNIEIKNIKFLGNFDSSTPGGTGTEHAHAICLQHCNNIEIHDCEATNMWGDFVYVGGGRTGEAHEGQSTNVSIHDNKITNPKRCCVAFVHCDSVNVINNIIDKQYTYVATFDIEPNDSAQSTTNIRIDGNVVDTTGIYIKNARTLTNALNPKNLVINNNHIIKCSSVFHADLPSNVSEPYTDNVIITNNSCDTQTSTLDLFGCKHATVTGNKIPNTISLQLSENTNISGNVLKAIILNNSKNININGNLMSYKGYSLSGNCVAIVSGENYYITNNIMTETRTGVRVQLSGNLKKLTVKNNNIITSKYGIYCYADSTYTYTDIHTEDNNIYHDVQGDENADTAFVAVQNLLTRQPDTSNFFRMKGLAVTTTYIRGVTGQYVSNTNPTLQTDGSGSYYLKGWLCVDGENQTWIEDKLRV